MQQQDRLMPIIEKLALVIRAASEEVVRDHFGGEIIDELYNRFTKKLEQSALFSDSSFVPNLDLFTFLKRNGRE
ncbi:hypothetical protein SLEP1_g50933 [Rubroshorea leprosula]|uniref:Uncharacterized protein n=1 Tax=Rubroshorea leprosula TaxID=152421 RepID=A0AAV5M1K9_9ROSI|nr:hypothetical protein SLEP1_g50933 [Rubroshorea leprosula]